jgi:hypothetical protein
MGEISWSSARAGVAVIAAARARTIDQQTLLNMGLSLQIVETAGADLPVTGQT